MDDKKSKRHDMKWAQRKTGTHKRGKEDDKREKTREDEYQEICDNLAYLGDPYDDMDLEQKKVHGISLFYQLMKVCITTITRMS
jgi:hypothetical protein